jgi:hypothetical protein
LNRTTLIIAAGLFAFLFLAVVFMPDLKISGAIARPKPMKTDAELALDNGSLDVETARDVSALERNGVHVTLAQINAANSDAPENWINGAFVEMPKPVFETVNPVDADRDPHKAFCFAIRRETGVVHEIVYYNAGNVYPMGGVSLYGWIRSGCAAAVQASHQTISETNYMGRVLALVPKDQANSSLRRSISGNMYMACGQETKQRLKSLSEPRKTEMQMAELDRCHKLSGT